MSMDMDVNYDTMIAGQKTDVTEAIVDLAAMVTDGTVDWLAIAATLAVIGPIAQRLAHPMTNAVGLMAAERLAA